MVYPNLDITCTMSTEYSIILEDKDVESIVRAWIEEKYVDVIPVDTVINVAGTSHYEGCDMGCVVKWKITSSEKING